MLRMGLIMVWRGITRRLRRSAVIFAGVALAVAALVTLEAVMQGVTDAMIRNSVALHNGHVNASWRGAPSPTAAAGRVAASLGDVRAVLPRRRVGGTLVFNRRQAPILLYGVEPSVEGANTVVRDKIISGHYLAGAGQIVIGASVAKSLGAGVGDAVEFWRKGDRPAEFRVAGIYRTTIEDLDGRLCFAPLAEVASGEAELAVFLAPGGDADAAAAVARAVLPAGADVRTWRQSLAEVVELTALNRVSMNVVLGLALLILAFAVAATAYISVHDRMREFGILKAMGVSPRGITLLVGAETLVLVGAAALAGAAVGAGASLLWAQLGLDLSAWTHANRHFVASGVVRPRLVGRAIVLPMLVAVACGLLAGHLPARWAGRVSAVKALRRL